MKRRSTSASVAQRKISIHIKTDHPLIMADEKKIKQLLYIFIDNAIKYSEKSYSTYRLPEVTIFYSLRLPIMELVFQKKN